MAIQPRRFEPPANESDFEAWCQTLFRRQMGCENLHKFGRRGQKQFGVDLLGNLSNGDQVGVQCKLRSGTLLTPGEIDADCASTLVLASPLQHLRFATTGRRDTALQQHVLGIDRRHKTNGIFNVDIWFWDDIEEYLSQHPDLAATLYGDIPGSYAARVLDLLQKQETRPSSEVRSLTAVGSSERTAVDDEIDQVMELAKRGAKERARQLLVAMRELRWSQLDDRLRFRVLANLGTIEAAFGDVALGASLLRQSYALQPQRRRAQELLALAFQLEGKTGDAFELASRLCTEDPSESWPQSVRIRTAPPTAKYEELERSLPASLRDDTQVLFSLFNRALDNDDLVSAETYSKRLTDLEPSDPERWASFGTVLLAQVMNRVRSDLSFVTTTAEQRILGRAEEAFNQAETLWGERDKGLSFAAVFRNRATTRRCLGRPHEALSDAKRAFELAPFDADCALGYALELDFCGKDEEALETINNALSRAPSARGHLLLAVKLDDQGDPTNKRRAADVLFNGLKQLSGLEAADREDWLFVLLAILAELKDNVRASEALAVAKHGDVDAACIPILEVLVARSNGDASAEAAALDKSMVDASGDWPHGRLRRLADYLESAKRHAEGLKVFKLICPLDRLTVHTAAMLRCAENADEHEFALRVLETLRGSGQTNPLLLQMEASLCSRYREKDRLTAVLRAGMLSAPSDPMWRIQLALHALENKRSEWMPTGLDRLPSALEVSSQVGTSVASLRLRMGERLAAAKYAYTLHRRFPNDPGPSAALISAIFGPDVSSLDIPSPERVEVGSAVVFGPVNGGPDRVIIIEDELEPEPILDRNELPPSHPLATVLHGLKVDEEFDEPAPFTPRRCKVKGVRSKLIHRAGLLAKEWRNRYPDVPFIQEYEVGDVSAAKDDPKAALGDLYAELANQDLRITDFDAKYRNELIPLQIVARGIGRSVLQTMVHTIGNGNGVRCARGTFEERAAAIRNLRMARTATVGIVIDPTALATLFLLEQVELLSYFVNKPLICESSIEDMRRSLIDPSGPDGASMTMAIIKGKFTVQKIAKEEIAVHNERLVAFMSRIRQLCVVTGGGALAKVPAEERKLFENVFPAGTADSVAAALANHTLLWTDDLPLSLLLEQEWNHPTAWTYAVCLSFEELGSLSVKKVAEVGMSLNLWNYQFTGVSPFIITCALAADAWNPNGPKASVILNRFVVDHGPWRSVAQYVALAFQAIWREAPSRVAAENVSEILLTRVGRHSNAKQIRAALLSATDALLGLDVVGAELLKKQIRRLSAEESGTRIIVPKNF